MVVKNVASVKERARNLEETKKEHDEDEDKDKKKGENYRCSRISSIFTSHE